MFARERGWHLGIITKSDLMVRDLDLLKEIARRNVLSVNITITTIDEKLARLLEPRAPRPELRLQAVRKLRSAGVCVCVYPNPIMPGITDSDAATGRGGAGGARRRRDDLRRRRAVPPAAAQKVFLPFLESEFPHLAARYRETVRSRSSTSAARYKDALAERVRAHSRPLRTDLRTDRVPARSLGGGGADWTSFRYSEGWMELADFDYHLPEELIAQEALADRASSRMLVVYREEGRWEDRVSANFPEFLRRGRLPGGQRFARFSGAPLRPSRRASRAADRQEQPEARANT